LWEHPVLDARPVEVFRDLYPQGENYLVSPAEKKPYRVRRGGLVFTACSAGDLPVMVQVSQTDCLNPVTERE